MDHCEALSKTRAIASYMRRLLHTEISDWPRVPMPNWPLQVLQDVHNMVHVVKQALSNQSECCIVWENALYPMNYRENLLVC
jgi:hypothetical protein